MSAAAQHVARVEVSMAQRQVAQLAAKMALRLVVNGACVMGDDGVCLACDARPGEPCRNPGLRP